MMDPAAEITQVVDHVPIPESPCADANSLQHSPAPGDPVSKVLNDDNLLIEIIIRLGFPTTLVQAALVCKRWLHHASDPAFLRRFRKLHPPRLLGFYLDVRSLSLGYKPTRPCFVPMLPQPEELSVVARRAASYSFDAYHNVMIGDCQNSNILIRGCDDGTSTFGAGASSLSRLIHFGEVISPLCSERAVAIIPCPPSDRPKESTFIHTRDTLFKQGGHDLYCLSLFVASEGENSLAHVYMLKDGNWCMHTSVITQRLCIPWGGKPLLVDNKLYIPSAPSDIVVLDLKTSSFSKIQLPEGVEYGDRNTLFSRTADDSRVYLIHVKEFELRIWLHNRDIWLPVDAICLREMLRMPDHMGWNNYTNPVQIKQVGENAQFVCLQFGRSILYLDIKCKILRKVYDIEDNQQCVCGIYPLMMTWPPSFPVLKDDPAREGSSVEMVGSETLNT